MNASRSALAKVHIAKKQLGLDDVTYRDCIQMVSRGRTRTAAELSQLELERLISHFKSVGFKPMSRSGKQLQALKKQILERAPRLGDNWQKRLNGLCRSVTGVARIEWIQDVKMARQLLAVIDSIRERSLGGAIHCTYLQQQGGNKHENRNLCQMWKGSED